MAIRSKTFKESYLEDIQLFQTIWIRFWMALLLIVLAVLPLVSDPYVVILANMSCFSLIAALGLNLLTGYTGLISLGHAGFVAVGAYTTGYLANNLELPFWICLPASAIMASGAGILIGIPCLRLKGLYLAIATMSFGIVMEFLIITLDDITAGVRGLSIPPIDFFGISLDTDSKLYYFLMTITVVFVLFSTNITRTRLGRALISIRDRDVAAEVLGVNLTVYKVTSFAISSFYAGLAGSLYAYVIGYVHPDNFTFLLSLQFLVMIIVGGLGSITGSIFGVIFITLLPEIIKALSESIDVIIPGFKAKYDSSWDIAVFGLLIMLFVIFEPKGLYGIWGRIKDCFRNWPYTY